VQHVDHQVRPIDSHRARIIGFGRKRTIQRVADGDREELVQVLDLVLVRELDRRRAVELDREVVVRGDRVAHLRRHVR
jgi:hypothetical protein